MLDPHRRGFGRHRYPNPRRHTAGVCPSAPGARAFPHIGHGPRELVVALTCAALEQPQYANSVFVEPLLLGGEWVATCRIVLGTCRLSG